MVYIIIINIVIIIIIIIIIIILLIYFVLTSIRIYNKNLNSCRFKLIQVNITKIY